MKTKPILFSTPMVQAILELRKSQTRRVLKVQPEYFINRVENRAMPITENGQTYFGAVLNGEDIKIYPSLNVGDVFWVRERFYTTPCADHIPPGRLKEYARMIYYTADIPNFEISRPLHRGKSRPSIFLPKAFSRIFLRVKTVKIERIQDISEEDAITEGVLKDIEAYPGNFKKEMKYRNYSQKSDAIYCEDARSSFMTLWQYINGKESWDANPWVFVYEFEPVLKPKDFLT